ncbi:hypothetical protein BDV10DRAFT_37291 [Aspergillus recurvatus]
MEDIKNCALCRGHLRDVARYGRLVRQALLEESTKKFILCMNRGYLPLAVEMAREGQSLQDHGYKPKAPSSAVIRFNGDRSRQIETMRESLGHVSVSRWGEILRLGDQIELYRRHVSPSEQPLTQVLPQLQVHAEGRMRLPPAISTMEAPPFSSKASSFLYCSSGRFPAHKEPGPREAYHRSRQEPQGVQAFYRYRAGIETPPSRSRRTPLSCSTPRPRTLLLR